MGRLSVMARAWLCAVLAGGCAAERAEPTRAVLTLRELDSCALDLPSRLSLTATGDFVPRSVELGLDVASTLDSMPPDTRYVRIEAQAGAARAGGVVPVPAHDLARDVLVLPLGRSCPLGDTLAALPPGAATVALEDGSLLVAGGRDRDGSVRSSAVRLAPGEQLVEQVPGGMLLPRAGATASASGLTVVVVGGGADDRGSAHGTFELFDRVAGRFDSARIGKLVAERPRRDHAALTLADGRVLVVGGRAEVGGAPLGSAELIDPVAGTASRVGDLVHGRYSPGGAALDERSDAQLSLLGLDDGQVLVVGGVDADGEPVHVVERFDVNSGEFEEAAVAPPGEDGVVERVAVAALPGARVAWLACVDGPPPKKTPTCRLHLILLGVEEPRSEVVTLQGADAATRAFFPVEADAERLEQVRLLALDDGRLLLTARAPDRVSVERVAMAIDPSTGAVRVLDASRVPERLLALADGSVAELDASGASLRRELLVTPFDDPPADPLGSGAVALDAPSRWARSGPELRAREDGARLDLPLLHYLRARVSLRLGGPGPELGALLLLGAGAEPRRVDISEDALSVGDCTLARSGDADVEVDWDAPSLTLREGERASGCTLEDLPAHVRFGLSLAEGARVEGLHVQRL